MRDFWNKIYSWLGFSDTPAIIKPRRFVSKARREAFEGSLKRSEFIEHMNAIRAFKALMLLAVAVLLIILVLAIATAVATMIFRAPQTVSSFEFSAFGVTISTSPAEAIGSRRRSGTFFGFNSYLALVFFLAILWVVVRLYRGYTISRFNKLHALQASYISEDGIAKPTVEFDIEAARVRIETASSVSFWILILTAISTAIAVLTFFREPIDKGYGIQNSDKTELLIIPGPTLPASVNLSLETGPAIETVYFDKGDERVSVKTEQRLSELGKTLSQCATNDKPVELVVYGFASTLEYSGETREESDNRNTILATNRATLVAEPLNFVRNGTTLVKATAYPWSSYAHMVRNLNIIDRPGNEEGATGLEPLNQMAVVYLKSAAACAPAIKR